MRVTLPPHNGAAGQKATTSMLDHQKLDIREKVIRADNNQSKGKRELSLGTQDIYYSADVETDGPVPGPFSMLSFAIVHAGSFNGEHFIRPKQYENVFYCELKPISHQFQQEALDVNKLDRERLLDEGLEPSTAMDHAYEWISDLSLDGEPVLVAYPLSFDWTWLFWYFSVFCKYGSPFNYSRCYDIKTAVAVKSRSTINSSSRSKLPKQLLSKRPHTHNAIDDAIEQAEIFANVFEWIKE
ncbi:MAG: 3'-5' exoribonuclease domain-containing protein [Roseovarius sp.]|uniref:3'-5' exoribonuclease domain-containing protein n=1 Tax=Roseovarius sp. TaxID=1486281 RepID=UPI00405833D8